MSVQVQCLGTRLSSPTGVMGSCCIFRDLPCSSYVSPMRLNVSLHVFLRMCLAMHLRSGFVSPYASPSISPPQLLDEKLEDTITFDSKSPGKSSIN